MNKIFIFTVLLCSISLNAQIVNTPATAQEKELIGNVQQLVERVYDVYKDNLQQKRLAVENSYIFDEQGNTTSLEQNYGNTQLRYKYIYLPNNKPIEVTITKEAHNEIIVTNGRYEYEQVGRLKSFTNYLQGVETPTQIFTFTDYDDRDNPITGKLTTPNSEATVQQEFNKDNQRTSLLIVTKSEPATQIHIQQRYDKLGRVVERSISEGLVTNPSVSVLRYTYNKKSIITAVNDQKLEYTFDKQGNWITRLTLVKGKIVGYAERNIKYY